MIHFFSEDTAFELSEPEENITWISRVIEAEKHQPGNLNYIFTSDNYLLEVNIKYLNHNYLTDVITFDYTDKNTLSGDVFISIDRVRDNAKEMNIPEMDELHRVMVHGVLHLLGYGDKTTEEQQVMRQKEDYYLSLRSEK